MQTDSTHRYLNENRVHVTGRLATVENERGRFALNSEPAEPRKRERANAPTYLERYLRIFRTMRRIEKERDAVTFVPTKQSTVIKFFTSNSVYGIPSGISLENDRTRTSRIPRKNDQTIEK